MLMSTSRFRRILTICCVLLTALPFAAMAQVTAIGYQGKLTDGGNPANGSYDMLFDLYDTPTVGTGTHWSGQNQRDGVAVSAGIFAVTLDFSNPYMSAGQLYLEIAVRPAGGGAYTTLSPRQQLTASPYAVHTLNAQMLGNVPASQYVAGDGNSNVALGALPDPTTKLKIISGPAQSPPRAISLYTNGFSAGWDFYHGSTRMGYVGAPNSLTNAGVWGVGTGSGSIGVHGEANVANAVGVFGVSTSPGGFGMFARNTAGRALYVEGHASQDLGYGGLVKAMVEMDTDISISSVIYVLNHCYNGVTNSTTGLCGFTITQPIEGVARINFGFNISNRFFSVSPRYAATGNSTNNSGANYRRFDSTTMEVFTFVAGNSADTQVRGFTLIMY